MSDWLVRWEINIFDADTPEEAAREALKIHRDPESIATVFKVVETDSGGSPISYYPVVVDLDEPYGSVSDE